MAGLRGRETTNDRGFTLVELLAALTLVGVLLTLVGSIFLWGYRHVGRTVDTFDLRTDGYTVLREITAGFDVSTSGRQAGLIAARSVQFTSDSSAKRLEYTWGVGAGSKTLAYVWAAPSGPLTREIEDLTPQIVLQNVEEFQVCLDDALIMLKVTQRNDRIPRRQTGSTASIYPRNATPSNLNVPEC